MSACEGSLSFRRDRYRYEPAYLDNAQAAAMLRDFVKAAGPGNIDSVSVVAWASPEGVYEHNLMLSRRRAAEFEAAVRSCIGLEREGLNLQIRAGGEAWDLLQRRVEADTLLPGDVRSRLLALLSDGSVGKDTIKWRLARTLGTAPGVGDVYQYLLQKHYRYLRCLEITLFYRNPVPVGPIRRDSVAAVQGTPVPAGVSVPHGRGISPPPQEKPLHPVLAVSTNLLFDICYIPGYGLTSIPNVKLEYYPRSAGRWSAGISLDWPMWRHPAEHRYFQIQNISLHARWYWGRRHVDDRRGPYLTAIANLGRYGIGWAEKGWEGEGAGGAVGIGYKRSLFGSRRLWWDAGIAAGFFYSRYDPYVWGNDATRRYYYDYDGAPQDFVARNHSLSWLGPLRVWLSVGIDLFNRRSVR